MATALYRRYRPEAFSEMIGQAHVTEPLMTALRSGRVGHAYLFSGPRGCGKTTSARILARCLNCAEGPTDTPCGTCPSCIELSREGGGSLDVVEIDAASHGGVDDARELRERAVFAPARDRYKIFIIDEAHMVTSGGFNALLKIVEEPPPHVKFIFATTEPDKVIGTIRSRTHHYPFRLIAPGALIDYVQQLCDSEGVSVDQGVLPLVVRAGGGSVRDTLSILDQLIAGSEDGAVTLDRAAGLLGFTSIELLDEVVTALGAGDAAAAFAAADRVVQTGQDPRRFVEDLLERLRDLIVIGATTVQGASAVFRGVPDDQLQRMFEQSQAFSSGRLSRIADTVSAALDKMTGATAPRLHLELMVARALVTSASANTGAGETAGPASAASAAAAAAPASAPRAAPPQGAPRPTARPDGGSTPAAPAPGPVAVAPAPSPASVPAPSSPAAPAAESAVDVVAAMRSAREFLKNDGSGGQREAAGAGSAAPAPSASVSASAPEAPETAGSAESATTEPAAAAVEPVGLSELREVWPELLDELLESDREAWNAVRGVQPLALDGDVLTVGVASRSDLEVFKSSGAGPLREAIEAALGVTVKYVPRQLPAAAAQAAGRESQAAGPDAEPSPATESASTDEPRTAPTARPDPQTEESVSGAQPPREPEYSEPPAPAWADAHPFDDDPGPADDDPGPFAEEPAPVEEPVAGSPSAPAEPAAERGPEPQPESEPELRSEPDPAPDPEPASEPAGAEPAGARPERVAAPVPDAVPAPVPVGNRYGEAVVRELLGARFIEERPLPQGEG